MKKIYVCNDTITGIFSAIMMHGKKEEKKKSVGLQ